MYLFDVILWFVWLWCVRSVCMCYVWLLCVRAVGESVVCLLGVCLREL